MPKLSQAEVRICEGKLSISECYRSLHLFQNNKSPGNNGLTVEFYKAFWNIVGIIMIESLNYSYDHGELSNSQREAIITLSEKKDKDKRDLSNWRPISLIDVDVKIGLKAIAKRLESILPKLVHYNQSVYEKGRTIFDAIRTIEDVMEFKERYNINGKMVCIDFNPLTPKSAIWHYKTHCFSKNCNFLNCANFALSISCEHCLESSSN